MNIIDFKWEMNRNGSNHDYYDHVVALNDLNDDVYLWFQENKGNSGSKIRKTDLWLKGKALQIYNNKDGYGGILTCWKCEKEIISLKQAVLHHNIYNIKQYFGEFGDFETVVIVHNKCHKKIHGWD